MTAQTENGWRYRFALQKRRALRFLYRAAFRAAYFLSPEWAFNAFLLSMPSEMIPELLKEYGARIGENTVIYAPLRIHNMQKDGQTHFANLEIGAHCYLGPELFIDLSDRVTIEDRATISMRVSLLTHMHVGESPLREAHFPPRTAPIVIGRGAYIGAGTTVLQGVSIGEEAAIGAGSLANRDVAPHTLAAGCPARLIRKLEGKEE